MAAIRPYILTISGFDPSGGAGILSDIKTIEANGGYGLGVLSANTWQNDIAFEKVEWISLKDMQAQINILTSRFHFKYIKIGIVENLTTLYELLLFLRKKIPDAIIVWDPILKASAGFLFHKYIEKKLLENILNLVSVITPNLPEAEILFGAQYLQLFNEISKSCAVYLKAGHTTNKEVVIDVFYCNKNTYYYKHERLPKGNKHGSGCVLSSALITALANDLKIEQAAETAAKYTHHFLSSSNSLIGYHFLNKINI